MFCNTSIARLAVCAAAVLASSATFACRCKEMTIPMAYESADAVLYGYTSDFIDAPERDGGTAIIEVEQRWKSNLPKRIVVNTQTSCAFDFQKGTHYLLFLSKNEAGFYETGLCYGNKKLPYASDLDAELRKLSTQSRSK